eukprot:TRINITY_DN23660_c0_g1_i1.p1 TRINITY_DN23660_c0_g1~~TRINITY_DN23660_c0_g1_i1.p1  ORF type:complete len:838 (+),score=135.43 TRINITY_DN23660_c0_g1_i1:72-2585(+)
MTGSREASTSPGAHGQSPGKSRQSRAAELSNWVLTALDRGEQPELLASFVSQTVDLEEWEAEELHLLLLQQQQLRDVRQADAGSEQQKSCSVQRQTPGPASPVASAEDAPDLDQTRCAQNESSCLDLSTSQQWPVSLPAVCEANEPSPEPCEMEMASPEHQAHRGQPSMQVLPDNKQLPTQQLHEGSLSRLPPLPQSQQMQRSESDKVMAASMSSEDLLEQRKVSEQLALLRQNLDELNAMMDRLSSGPAVMTSPGPTTVASPVHATGGGLAAASETSAAEHAATSASVAARAATDAAAKVSSSLGSLSGSAAALASAAATAAAARAAVELATGSGPPTAVPSHATSLGTTAVASCVAVRSSQSSVRVPSAPPRAAAQKIMVPLRSLTPREGHMTRVPSAPSVVSARQASDYDRKRGRSREHVSLGGYTSQGSQLSSQRVAITTRPKDSHEAAPQEVSPPPVAWTTHMQGAFVGTALPSRSLAPSANTSVSTLAPLTSLSPTITDSAVATDMTTVAVMPQSKQVQQPPPFWIAQHPLTHHQFLNISALPVEHVDETINRKINDFVKLRTRSTDVDDQAAAVSIAPAKKPITPRVSVGCQCAVKQQAVQPQVVRVTAPTMTRVFSAPPAACRRARSCGQGQHLHHAAQEVSRPYLTVSATPRAEPTVQPTYPTVSRVRSADATAFTRTAQRTPRRNGASAAASVAYHAQSPRQSLQGSSAIGVQPTVPWACRAVASPAAPGAPPARTPAAPVVPAASPAPAESAAAAWAAATSQATGQLRASRTISAAKLAPGPLASMWNLRSPDASGYQVLKATPAAGAPKEPLTARKSLNENKHSL